MRKSTSPAPRFEVRTNSALEQSIKRPLLSVIRPSSNTPRKMFITSAWAFSISSSSTTL